MKQKYFEKARDERKHDFVKGGMEFFGCGNSAPKSSLVTYSANDVCSPVWECVFFTIYAVSPLMQHRSQRVRYY